MSPVPAPASETTAEAAFVRGPAAPPAAFADPHARGLAYRRPLRDRPRARRERRGRDCQADPGRRARRGLGHGPSRGLRPLRRAARGCLPRHVPCALRDPGDRVRVERANRGDAWTERWPTRCRASPAGPFATAGSVSASSIRRMPTSAVAIGRRPRAGAPRESFRGRSSRSVWSVGSTSRSRAPGTDWTWSSAPDVTASFSFEGDEFEMEDQRNWTDASFKTYSTPLSLGLVHEAVAGQTLDQRVTLRCRSGRQAGSPVASRSARRPSASRSAIELLQELDVVVPAIGAACRELPASPAAVSAIASLGLHHHRVDIDLETQPGGVEWLAAREPGSGGRCRAGACSDSRRRDGRPRGRRPRRRAEGRPDRPGPRPRRRGRGICAGARGRGTHGSSKPPESWPRSLAARISGSRSSTATRRSARSTWCRSPSPRNATSATTSRCSRRFPCRPPWSRQPRGCTRDSRSPSRP